MQKEVRERKLLMIAKKKTNTKSRNADNQDIAIKSSKASPAYLAVKRALDIVLSGTGLLVLSPVLAVIAILIKLEDGGPVLHHRWCVGKNGKYDMLKFRTMVTDANNFEKYFTPEQMEEYKKNIKLDNDPRITKVGNFLRRKSLDELMQLVTIFRGDMSIVGPRPMVEDESKHFGNQLVKVLEAKPGLTGYWQVNGRSDCTYESGERQKLELYYVEHRSLGLDISIFFKTFAVVINGKGAR